MEPLTCPPPLLPGACVVVRHLACSDALKWAETSLELMQAVAELPRAHPALEPHIQLVIELKQKTGGWVCGCLCGCVMLSGMPPPHTPCSPGRRQVT